MNEEQIEIATLPWFFRESAMRSYLEGVGHVAASRGRTVPQHSDSIKVYGAFIGKIFYIDILEHYDE